MASPANSMKVEIRLTDGEFTWLRPETEAKLNELATDLFTDTGAKSITLTRGTNAVRETFVAESVAP